MDIVTLKEALKKAEILKRAKNDASKYDSSTGPQSSLSAIKSGEPNSVSYFILRIRKLPKMKLVKCQQIRDRLN